MSSLTNADVSVLIRRRLGASVAERLRYVPLIESAGLRLARRIADDPMRRHLMLTDPATVTLALDGNGVGDLTTLIGNPRILPDKLGDYGIYHASNQYPLHRIRNVGIARVTGNYDAMFLHYWLEGVKLHTKSGAPAPLDLLSLEVSYWATLAQMREELVEPLVEECIELLAEAKAEYEEEGEK